MSGDFSTTLEVGDRVFQVALRTPQRTRDRCGTVSEIYSERPGGRTLFAVQWDGEKKVSRGWLRHAFRKIPKGSAR